MRYFIFLSYDGKEYHGWQIQPNGKSVQETLQNCLSTILRTKTEIVGAGRTDTGVNAIEMIAHFDSSIQFDPIDLTYKLNKFVPRDISIYKIVRVKDNAHARFDATSRTYKYYISTSKHAMLRHYSFFYGQPLDFEKMNEAAKCLFNYEDFTSFSKLHTDTKTNICHIKQAEWKKVKNYPLVGYNHKECELWEFTIEADRFLRNMVRAVVGTLLDVGRGILTLSDFCEIIERKDRCEAGMSVPGNALFLYHVEYPEAIYEI